MTQGGAIRAIQAMATSASADPKVRRLDVLMVAVGFTLAGLAGSRTAPVLSEV